MARILGLDLGSHAVKGVVLEAKTKTHTTHGFAEVRRAQEGERADTLRAAVQELLAQLPPGNVDQIVIALPGPALTTHALSLPFSDARRIEATLPFEVGSQLPFDISDVVYDYQVVGLKDGEGKEKASDLLVGVVRKEELAALLALLAELKVDPRVITHPGLAYQNLFQQHAGLFEGVGEGGAVAVVDIGHERTSVSVGRPGEGVQFARTFSGGGKDLSKALATEFQTSLAEAHHWKEQHGAVASAAQGPDAERAAAAFARGLQPMLRELRPTLKAFTARTRQQVGAVVLCGGTAKLPGIAEQLSRDLNLPVRVLALPADAKAIPAAEQPVAAQAYALSLRGNAAGVRAPRFNLRRGEFAFKGDFDYVKDKLGLLASFAATLILLLIAFGVVRNSVLARREAQVDAVLCDTTQRILGRCEKDYNRALNMLAGVESPAAALPKLTAVNLLAEVTGRVPEDMEVKFTRIQIDLGRVILEGETDSSKQIDTLSNAIRNHDCFKDVRQGKVEKTRDGSKMSFRLDVQVQCPGEQGGES
ncbi:pilus assembly protein PilM [Corallococcus macrosporus]|uniref:Putative general secretion pathway protein L n=1 Tax=Myxococcus fulvus (strain ATCC BAA-855 / HW-1) TaxID=483219 RepID=F8CBX4_MYXFH|nr:type II secretion system protein GspL [Corallococcus macrosporus]AEI65940.1 putative general secretion pathway protein L [Corallococcus macrosporus]